VGIDIIIAFAILVGLIVYFIYSRTKFEKNIVNLYEQKFEEWKIHNPSSTSKPSCKELVGLVFKQNGKLSVELFKSEVKQTLKQGKFEIKE
jgi:uncharacterized membrane protein YraQ (UPF0718 family)